MIRTCKVEVSIKLFTNQLMLREFFTVIRSYCMDGTFDRLEHAIIAALTLSAVLRSSKDKIVSFVFLAKILKIAPLWPDPMIVSASRSPTRCLVVTILGLCSISMRFGIRPLPEVLLRRLGYFLPRCRSRSL